MWQYSIEILADEDIKIVGGGSKITDGLAGIQGDSLFMLEEEMLIRPTIYFSTGIAKISGLKHISNSTLILENFTESNIPPSTSNVCSEIYPRKET